MHRWLLASSFAFTAAIAAPAAAQTAPPQEEDSQIVVTGARDREKQIRDFVGALAATPGRGQLGRFEATVCPLVIGLSPRDNEAVARRMGRIAKGLNLPVGGADCQPNVLVAVVDKKREFLQALMRKQPALFSDMAPSQVRRLVREPGPVSAWQRKGWISEGGTELIGNSEGGTYVNNTFGSNPLTAQTAHPYFRAAVVVMEAEAGRGLTTTQLADYAAMRALARTDPSRVPASVPSILSAIGAPVGAAVPITLTQWDLGYLRGLYTSPDNMSAGLRRAEIGRQLGNDLARSEKDEKGAE